MDSNRDDCFFGETWDNEGARQLWRVALVLGADGRLTFNCKMASSAVLPAISRPKSFNFLLLVLKLAVDDLC
jgi:hypothetical protein